MLQLDATKLYQKVRTYEQRSPGARLEAAREVMAPLMAEIVALTPIDTGRLAAGYAQAANAAGLGPIAVPPIQPSKRAEEAERKLEEQIKYFQKVVEQLDRIIAAGGGQFQGKGIDRSTATRRRATAQRRVQRAQKQLEKWLGSNDRGIVIGLFFAAGGTTGNQVATTVREDVKGGTGSAVVTQFFSGYRIHNLEPHATLVERNTGTVKAALNGAKAFRIKRVGRKYLASIGAGDAARRAAG